MVTTTATLSTTMETVANRDGRVSGGRSRGPFHDAPPSSIATVVPRTEGYTYDARVWDLSIVQGPFSIAPWQTFALRFATFASLYACHDTSLQTRSLSFSHTHMVAWFGPGNDTEPGSVEMVMHFFTFFWKVMFACIPPVNYYGGWLTFNIAILAIGIVTAIVGEIASLFGYARSFHLCAENSLRASHLSRDTGGSDLGAPKAELLAREAASPKLNQNSPLWCSSCPHPLRTRVDCFRQSSTHNADRG
jgi:hypothetical protein